MSKFKFTFLLGYPPNPRMQKRINVASSIGSVQLVQWDKAQNKLDLYKNQDLEHYIIKIKASEKPINRLPEYFEFKRKAIQKLSIIRPDLIHLQGLDMLAIAYEYKKRIDNKVKIIYEIADLHKYLSVENGNAYKKLVRNSLVTLERKCKPFVDKLILTSPMYYDSYYSQFYSKDEYVVLENYPDLSAFEGFKSRNYYNNPFTISYIGGVRYKKQIEILLDVAAKLPIQINFAGYEDGTPVIEDRTKVMENVKWHGKFDYKTSIKELYSEADIIFSVYDTDLRNVRIALPNKYYEAIYTQKPIIVAKGTYLQKLVEKHGVGVAIDSHSESELIQAINYLSQADIYKKIVENCAKAKSFIKDGRHTDAVTKIYNDALTDI